VTARVGLALLAFLALREISPGEDVLKVTAPQAPWVLTLPKGELVVSSEKVSPDGKESYVMASDKKSGLNISFFVEPAQKCHSSRECRDMVQKAGFTHLGGARNFAAAEVVDVSVIECFVPEFQGVPVEQGHFYAEFVEAGYWVDAHMSKVRYTPADRQLFVDTVKSIAFIPKAADH
jgi:hypothetical protein